jgi:glycosyltransferase involved in cell wall biosynthesis
VKILQLGKFYPPDFGGIETVLFDITEVLNLKGYKTDVLCSNKKYKYLEDDYYGYKVIRTKTFGIFFSTSITPQIIWKLKRIVDEYDIIHVHLPDPMANLALYIVNPKNKKIVIHWHSDIIKQKYLLKLYEPLQNWLLKKSDKIIATTPKYINESKYLSQYKSKCISIPIGINKKKLVPNNKKVEEIINKYKNKKIIFSLGRLTYYKGFNNLILSANYLDDSFVVLIGGSGKLKEELKNLIDKENLNGKVKLLGGIDSSDLANFYKACNLFCLPSVMKSEAFGVVQIEAMSFSKPIVATRIKGSGVDWVNKDGVSGINVEVNNPKALAAGFKYINSSDKLYREFSRQSNNRFLKNFQRDKMVDAIIDVYTNL